MICHGVLVVDSPFSAVYDTGVIAKIRLESNCFLVFAYQIIPGPYHLLSNKIRPQMGRGGMYHTILFFYSDQFRQNRGIQTLYGDVGTKTDKHAR